ncbi:hypothetical protein FYE33_17080 [Salmonella enterica]|nr:hypothetical protein [Salmonella enterica]EEP3372998.1 hypothetical protein [Salmonella enterica]EFP6579705.1 hypothetical protein [Salmonella enterica]EGC7970988.1 hypothetical protein [Salmonella enterica]
MMVTASLVFSVFMSLGIGGLLIICLILPLETTGFGIKGGIPSRISNVLTAAVTICIVIAMIAYWLK